MNTSNVDMAKAVVLLSGGMDSTTLLYDLVSLGYEVRALIVAYGQKHSRELASALDIASRIHVSVTVADVDTRIFEGAPSSQVGLNVSVPHGHYADDSMRVTVVPNRNMLLLALAGAVAEAARFQFVAYAAHAGDHAVYPDCRPEFASAMDEALQLGTYGKIQLLQPFIRLTKADIVRRGWSLSVPYELTYSCYEGLELHCGKCGTCVERKEAFQLAGVVDPTRYADAKANG